jgi:hypothetical protein
VAQIFNAVFFTFVGVVVAWYAEPLGDAALRIVGAMNAFWLRDPEARYRAVRPFVIWSVRAWGVMIVLGVWAVTIAWVAGAD